MRRSTPLWALVFLLCSTTVHAQNNDTVRSWDALWGEYDAAELGSVGNKYLQTVLRQGYTVYQRTSDWRLGDPPVLISQIISDLQVGYGIWMNNTHTTVDSQNSNVLTGQIVEVYPFTSQGQADRHAAYLAYQADSRYKNYVFEGTGSNSYYIGMRLSAIRDNFYSWGSLVINGCCLGHNYASYWNSARAVLDYNYCVLNTTVRADLDTVFTRMNGSRGYDNRVLAFAINGSHFSFSGDLNTVLSPAIYSVTPAPGTVLTSTTPLRITFDCPMDVHIPASLIMTATGNIGLSRASWTDGNALMGYVGPWQAGTGRITVAAYDPANYIMDGAKSESGGIGLDGDGVDGKSPFTLNLSSLVNNPAASLSSFTATRRSDGALVEWRPESQSGTHHYLVMRSNSLLGPWQSVVSVPADSTQWYYSVLDAGITNAIYELREVENTGDTLVLGDAELRDPFLLPADPVLTSSYVDSLTQAVWPGPHDNIMQPQAVLPIYDITYVVPHDPTGAWTAKAQILATDRENKGYIVNIITMDDVGGTREGLHNYIVQASRYGLRGVTLCAASESSDIWWKYPWINGWVAPAAVFHPEWNLIPTWDWPDPIGVQSQSISWFMPGMTSDMPYGDLSSPPDSIPEIAVTRIPATTPDELGVAAVKILNFERQDLSNGTYLVANQGRSYNGESGAWASALADSFAAMIPLTKVRLHDTDLDPKTHAQNLYEFLSVCASNTIVGATFTGTVYNRNKMNWIDRTQGDSWSSLGNGQFLCAIAAPTCELNNGVNRPVDPTYGRGLGSTSFAFFPNQGPAWVWSANGGSHQGANTDLGGRFFFHVYGYGAWSGAAAVVQSIHDVAQNWFTRYQAIGTQILGDVATPFPGQIIRTTDVVVSGGASQLRLGLNRNPVYGPAKINLAIPSAQSVDLAVYDLQGRRLTTLWHGQYPAGQYTVSWDGTANGVRLAAGMYFLHLSCPSGHLSQKVTMLR